MDQELLATACTMVAPYTEGAWVEISSCPNMCPVTRHRPHTGAGVEILLFVHMPGCPWGVPHTEERGLNSALDLDVAVTPHGRGGRSGGLFVMKSVYILLTRTTTGFSRLIHAATKYQYTHASIGLDGPGGIFYSFGRVIPWLCLPARMVAENVGTGYFGSHPDTPCCLLHLLVSEKCYRDLHIHLREMYRLRVLYRYNLLGVLLAWKEISQPRRFHKFCSEFVGEQLESYAGVRLPRPPALLSPMDLYSIEAFTTIYQGSIAGLQGLRSFRE